MPDPNPQQPKPTPKPAAKPAPGVDPLMDQLVSASPMLTAKSCPKCDRLLQAEAILCPFCGFDLEQNKIRKTRVIKSKEPKEPKVKRRGPSFSILSLADVNPMMAALLIGGLNVGTTFAFSAAPSTTTFAIWAIGTVIASILAFFFIVIEAFAEGQGFWGVVALTLFIPGVNLISVWVTIYYLLRIADGSLGRWVYFTQVLCGVLSYFILFTSNPSPFEVLRDNNQSQTAPQTQNQPPSQQGGGKSRTP